MNDKYLPLQSQEEGSTNKDENVVEALFSHYFPESNGDSMPFGTSQKVAFLIQILGATAGIYAWPPAAQFSQGQPDWISWSIQITNPGSSVLFLMNATADLLNEIDREITRSSRLPGILVPPNKAYLIEKYSKMAVGSAICAIPFGILTYFFPLPGCTSNACLGVIVAHSWLSNLIMHALAWGFILSPDYWYYRIPIMPIEKLFSAIYNTRLTNEQQVALQRNNEIQAIFSKYHSKISAKIAAATTSRVEYYLDNFLDKTTVDLSIFKADSLIEYIENSASHTIRLEQVTVDETREALITRGTPAPSNTRTLTVIKFAGGLFIMVGITGWIVSPFYLGQKVLKLDPAGTVAFGILPAYSTVVLSSFFGSLIMPRIYLYMSDLHKLNANSWKNKLSYEARMYPVVFTGLVLLNVYISAFAYANGIEYIDSTNFNNKIWTDTKPVLKGIAIPALVLLSFVPLLDLINTGIRNYVCYSKSVDPAKREACRLLCKSTLFGGRISQLDGKKMMNNINSYTVNQRKLLDINEEELSRDLAEINQEVKM